jgi:hypothetical protein
MASCIVGLRLVPSIIPQAYVFGHSTADSRLKEFRELNTRVLVSPYDLILWAYQGPSQDQKIPVKMTESSMKSQMSYVTTLYPVSIQ